MTMNLFASASGDTSWKVDN